MASYLVTGGCGFIGVNLVSRLVARGQRVRVLDNLSLGTPQDLDPGAELIVGDIRDSAAVAKAAHGMEIVVHLAAHTRVVESVSDPQLNFEINAAGTLNVLRAAAAAGAQKFIFASTGGAIVGEQELPVHEGMVPCPKSPYGASKLAGEAYCSAFCGSFGLNTVALRFSNVYGTYSHHKGSVIAQFFKHLIEGEPLVIYGDGRQTRDFLYVDDLIDAVLLAAKANVPGQVFQIATGRETSLTDLVALMREVVGHQLNVQYQPPRAGEVFRNYASIAKARNVLGYEPRTSLREGLHLTWEWFSSRSDEPVLPHA